MSECVMALQAGEENLAFAQLDKSNRVVRLGRMYIAYTPSRGFWTNDIEEDKKQYKRYVSSHLRWFRENKISLPRYVAHYELKEGAAVYRYRGAFTTGDYVYPGFVGMLHVDEQGAYSIEKMDEPEYWRRLSEARKLKAV